MENVIHIPNFLDDDLSNRLFKILENNIKWNKINYFKRHVHHYDLSLEELNELIVIISNTYSRKIMGVFCNFYADGNEYAPYHADKYNCDTCLVSLGVERTLRFKNNDTKLNTDFILKNGDLLFMPDDINNNYKHSLLKRTKINEPRISLLFFLE